VKLRNLLGHLGIGNMRRIGERYQARSQRTLGRLPLVEKSQAHNNSCTYSCNQPTSWGPLLHYTHSRKVQHPQL